ncbi:conserved hypothetical protein [Candidatus Defluviicoccus seviourii]|uniref:Aldolase n=1 Tax=Candidatus Defluviicoccus seviourii TaxID=2565273 RepID=A0A564WA33_9PROT|nr:conserved hypothetical protein [Candidatus Defluviicoccus seviourii]
MTDAFREIEKSHEAKFKLDEERQFKAQSRCNRRLGAWAAERMGLAGSKAGDYAQALVLYNLDHPEPHAVIAKIESDFAAAGVQVGEREIIAHCERFRAEALEELLSVYPDPLDADHMQIGG